MAIYTHNEVQGSPSASWFTAFGNTVSGYSSLPTEVIINDVDGSFTHFLGSDLSLGARRRNGHVDDAHGFGYGRQHGF